ncbi:septal ring lytic transglycosylase RlpA family protein [Pontibacter ramchanderi]|uniref:Probable endolytic peptidoglycan transglycosylase RlpA n=1 Tax=Pontibacter ramchanderi TaxID=1179743 RepID=A0A2N3UD97_9BACT|nr:septal ring lytic transglycosylase RlpA family protein [Pontibacter ramchanderi]PKV67344.1 rare lipoprotein A [Pontibacter ramchanderi]
MKNDRKCILLTVIIFLFIGVSQPTFAQSNDKTQIGAASWYGSKYHGRKTSSGERYNKNEMTAAHKTLPFGTMVKVTNPATDQSVVLRINDRGPFVGNRIIDVSEAAARKLGMHSVGVAKVKVEVLDKDAVAAANAAPRQSAFTIQTAANYKQAEELSRKLKAFDRHLPLEIAEEQVNGRKVVLVKAGKFNSRNEAEAFNDLLEEEGLAGKVSEA